MSELLGYSHGELLGKELWEIGLLKDEQANRQVFQELKENSFIRYENLPLETKGGQRDDQAEVAPDRAGQEAAPVARLPLRSRGAGHEMAARGVRCGRGAG